MADIDPSAGSERSLLDEIEELQVLEAEELQEGVAFHAFRFGSTQVLDSMIVTLHGDSTNVLKKLELPQGATLTDVQGSKLRILFDSDAVKPATLKAAVTQAIGKDLARLDYSKHSKVTLTELQGTKLA